MENMEQKKWKEITLPTPGRRKKVQWFDNTYVPYTTTFVYSKYSGNFIIRGYSNDVQEYLKKNHTHYFYNMCFISDGRVRATVWEFWNDNWSIRRTWEFSKKFPGHFILYRRGDGYSHGKKSQGKRKEYRFKRIPSRWIPLMDKCK